MPCLDKVRSIEKKAQLSPAGSDRIIKKIDGCVWSAFRNKELENHAFTSMFAFNCITDALQKICSFVQQYFDIDH